MRGVIRIAVKQGKVGETLFAALLANLREKCLTDGLAFEPDFTAMTITVSKEGTPEEVEAFMKRGLKDKAQGVLLKRFMDIKTEVIE